MVFLCWKQNFSHGFQALELITAELKKGGKFGARAPSNVAVAPENRKFNLSQDGDVTLWLELTASLYESRPFVSSLFGSRVDRSCAVRGVLYAANAMACTTRLAMALRDKLH